MKDIQAPSKVAAALLAAGLAVTETAEGQVIPLGDPSFQSFVVPANPGYAYAAPVGSAPAYRPTSPWVDDLDSPPGYIQDDALSNWLYTAAYAESHATSTRASPRTGGQAL